MLIEFRVKNFRSYKDEQVFSMVASADQELLENTIQVEGFANRRLLRSAVIYGPNASGKSNLMQAFAFMRSFVRTSDERKPDSKIPVELFRLDSDCLGQPSEFEISFIQGGIRYQYGFSADASRVYDEWLFAYPQGASQKWFERQITEDLSKYDWYFGPGLKGEKQRLVPLTRDNALFLSVAATFSHEQLVPVHQWFATKFKGITVNEMSDFLESWTAKYIHENNERASFTRHLMRFADVGVEEVTIQAHPYSEQDIPEEVLANMPEELKDRILASNRLEVKLIHEGGQKRSFSFRDESLGTRRLFALSGPWNEAIKEGHILFIDELDASLHPVLVKELLLLFNKAMGDAACSGQIIFNTHDVTLLDSTLFRRDQIWFTEKDKLGATHLYPLLDFSPRKKESLAKGYLQGRYGAIPFVEGILEGFTNG